MLAASSWGLSPSTIQVMASVLATRRACLHQSRPAIPAKCQQVSKGLNPGRFRQAATVAVHPYRQIRATLPICFDDLGLDGISTINRISLAVRNRQRMPRETSRYQSATSFSLSMLKTKTSARIRSSRAAVNGWTGGHAGQIRSRRLDEDVVSRRACPVPDIIRRLLPSSAWKIIVSCIRCLNSYAVAPCWPTEPWARCCWDAASTSINAWKP